MITEDKHIPTKSEWKRLIDALDALVGDMEELEDRLEAAARTGERATPIEYAVQVGPGFLHTWGVSGAVRHDDATPVPAAAASSPPTYTCMACALHVRHLPSQSAVCFGTAVHDASLEPC